MLHVDHLQEVFWYRIFSMPDKSICFNRLEFNFEADRDSSQNLKATWRSLHVCWQLSIHVSVDWHVLVADSFSVSLKQVAQGQPKVGGKAVSPPLEWKTTSWREQKQTRNLGHTLLLFVYNYQYTKTYVHTDKFQRKIKYGSVLSERGNSAIVSSYIHLSLTNSFRIFLCTRVHWHLMFARIVKSRFTCKSCVKCWPST